MRAYELMLLLEAEVDEPAQQAVLRRVEELLAPQGRIVRRDVWGRRRLAYEIDKRVEGFYIVLELTTEATNLDGLERALRLADEVVRHKLIRLPDREAARRGLIGTAAASE